MKNILFLLAVCLLIVPFCSASTQKHKKKFLFFKVKNATEQKDSVKKISEYEKLLGKKHLSAKGMMTLHIVEGKIYFELPISLLGREMLLGSTISKISDNSHAIVGSKPTVPLHVIFTKNDTHVQLCEVSVNYMTDNNLIDQTLANSQMPSILENTKILTYSPDSSAVVFEMTPFFVGDNKRMSPFDDVALIGNVKRTEMFKPGNSFVSGVKAFKDNVSITSVLSYTYTLSTASGVMLDQDAPFSAEMTRSIILLKKVPYRPRLADYRIGIFNTMRRKLGSGSNTTSPIYFSNRWDIQPKDTVAYCRGELVEPVKPIVFYMDNTFPKQWVPYIKEGIMQWNELFEEIGFKNVIQVKDFPLDDPEFDPDNIKYTCVRYAPSNFQNAMGPSWADPRSGEILTASVYVYHDVVKLIRQWLFVQTAQADPDVRTVNLPEYLLGDALRYVIAHEVGHCLGFMHNMSGSYAIPVDSLRSPSYTAKYGTTTSIMDYARFNYVAQPGDKERGVRLTPPRFGVYDKYLVAWNYRPVFDAATLEEEAKITSQWITDSLRKADYYRYGKQQFGSILDPRSQSEDLGNDAVRATQYGIENLKYITQNMDAWIDKDDDTYEYRQHLFSGIISQLTMYIRHVADNVGGYQSNEVKSTDDIPRYEPLSTSYQRKALQYLIHLYSDLDWLDEAPVLAKASISGSPKHLIQKYLQQIIFLLPIRVSTYELMASDSYKAAEAFQTIFDFVWNGKGSRKVISKEYATLQTAYLKDMISVVKTTGQHPSGMVKLANSYTESPMENLTHNQPTYRCGCSSCAAIAPVAGFEKTSYNRYAEPRTTKAEIYAYIMKAKSLIKSRIATTAGDTKAHYQVLLNTIEANFK